MSRLRLWSRARGWLIAGGVLMALGVVVTGASGAEEGVAIECPAYIPANGVGNTHSVPQHLGVGSHIPFTSVGYDYKRGFASTGTSWYWPDPVTTTHQGETYEWMNAGVEWSCRRVYFPPIWVDTYFKLGIEGYALIIPDASGPNDPNSADLWFTSEGSGSGAPPPDANTCYDIWWLVWIEWVDGSITVMVFQDSGYDVCYDSNGNMY